MEYGKRFIDDDEEHDRPAKVSAWIVNGARALLTANKLGRQ